MRPRGFPSFIALLGFAIAATIGACAANPISNVQRLPETTDVRILAMLDAVTVVDARPNPPGYDRDCGPDNLCVFGQAWSDNHSGTGGHNGCDTRNDVLARQLTDVVFRPGSRQCVVIAGNLRDPYTGALVPYAKGAIEIDHVFPLALAWDLGANTWPQERRVDFANDQANLLATERSVNRAKSDKSPAEWIGRVAPQRRCDYVRKFLTVALGYKLPILKTDLRTIKATAKACS